MLMPAMFYFRSACSPLIKTYFISVLHQLQALYFFRRIERLPPYFRIALMPFLTAPFQFTGWWVSAVLPKDESLYFNLIVLAEKSK